MITAIDQSLNKDCGKYTYLNTTEKALSKYYLTSHMKAAVTAMTMEMSGIAKDSNSTHNKTTLQAHTYRLICSQRCSDLSVSERMINPVEIDKGAAL